jgi:4-hydroxy-tetrahydrodipicolinate synthase
MGTFAHVHSRAVPHDITERHWAVETILDHIATGAERFRSRIANA